MGTLTLGENDGIISTTVPTIIGATYGVDNRATFNFYDGVIEGGTLAIYGSVTNTPEDYSIKYENDNKKATLAIEAVFENVVQVNGIYYNSLSAAISAIEGMSNKTGTIEINGEIALGAPVTIPEGTNITIQMQGHSITYDGLEAAIVNNGTLTIVDYLDTSEGDASDISIIKNTGGKAIENNETLVLGIDDGIVNSNSPVISGGIEGNTPTIYDGKIE